MSMQADEYLRLFGNFYSDVVEAHAMALNWTGTLLSNHVCSKGVRLVTDETLETPIYSLLRDCSTTSPFTFHGMSFHCSH